MFLSGRLTFFCLVTLSAVVGQCDGRSQRNTHSYSQALLNPNPRCPEFVQARKFNGGGLGHSFMAFNHLVSIASAHNVTIKARFSSTGHGTNGSQVDAFFFGDFFDVQLPNLSSGSSIAQPKLVNCSTVENFVSLLSQNRATGCKTSTATLYTIEAGIPPREGNIDVHLYRDAFAYTAKFRKGYVRQLQVRQLVKSLGQAPRQYDGVHGTSSQQLVATSDDSPVIAHNKSKHGSRTPSYNEDDFQVGDQACIQVAVHIRRGDIAHNPSLHEQKLRSRWVPNRAYLHVIDALYRSLSTLHDSRAHARTKRQVVGQHVSLISIPEKKQPCRFCINLHVEGATSASAVPDLDPENTQGYTDFQERLAKYGNVQVIKSNALSSFVQMCSSDILITGKSGYSHLISLLCTSPIILAFPMWHSYDYIPNAMMIDTVGRDRTWIDGATLNETAFRSLLARKPLVCDTEVGM